MTGSHRLAVGVTGHRVLADSVRIEAGVDAALARIERAFPGRPITLWSSLAEGADRIVARRALARVGARLIVPLPLEPDDYERDFGSLRSRSEFRELLAAAERVLVMPPSTSRSAAYEAAGLRMLEAAQVLLTVWDGAAARGRGGTGDIVQAARARRLPIAWVRAGNGDSATRAATSLGRLQGRTTFENFPDEP